MGNKKSTLAGNDMIERMFQALVARGVRIDTEENVAIAVEQAGALAEAFSVAMAQRLTLQAGDKS